MSARSASSSASRSSESAVTEEALGWELLLAASEINKILDLIYILASDVFQTKE